ncbi:MAG TPA: DJ-1/PfpI family protein [Acidimicrobiales bacterium]|nr:DJ-1/PfpI family protein [Acidimicrobiales bacterium]
MTVSPVRIGVVLFDRFELLDVFGPLEMFGVLPSRFEISLVGPAVGALASAQGPRSVVDHAYGDAPPCDILLVPGGIGNRPLLEDRVFLDWLAAYCAAADYVTSVCTGSALLAAAGLLDGYRATSNKRAFQWVSEHGRNVEWVSEARWVVDRNRWTSSGVAAGIDMALALIAHLCGDEVAHSVADGTEYDWHVDPDWDPFAAKNGLV